jgi:hypothetical protein
MTRIVALSALAAAVVVAAVAAGPAGAKGGVEARLVTPISRGALPGTRITVVWTLASVDGGKRRPFGAGGVFVRLFGRDSRSLRVYATTMAAPGRYRAVVRIPRGGVLRIEIGLMGTACDAEGCRRSPALFPIVGRRFRS